MGWKQHCEMVLTDDGRGERLGVEIREENQLGNCGGGGDSWGSSSD